MILTFMFLSWSIAAQTTFQGNGNTGFGDAIGTGSIVVSESGASGASGTVTFTVNTGTGSFNDYMVIYFDTGVTGRNAIDGTVDDQGDDGRRAISSAGSNASVINFPPGFQASHAIAVNSGFGGLWSIPSNGTVGNNGLPFQTAVGNATSAPNSTFDLTFTWADLGLTGSSIETLDFVVTYLNAGNGFLSNEGYGGGFRSSNYGSDDLTLTQYFRYQNALSGASLPLVGGVANTAQDGLWTATSTWSNGNVPLQEDLVSINDAISLDTNVSVSDLELTQIDADTPSFLVNDFNSFTTTNSIETNGFNFNVNGTLSTSSSTIDGDITVGPTGIIDTQIGTTTYNDNIIFQSVINDGTTPRNVGQLGEVVGNLVVDGEVTTEMYIPVATENTRAFRFISSSVNTTDGIDDNWQDDQDGDDMTTTAGVGTHITGMGGAANGFDTTPSNNPSLFSFDNTNVPATQADQGQSWNAVSNTTQNVDAGEPYRIFIRGDRNYDLNSDPANPPNNDTKLVSKGSLMVGPNEQQVVPEAGYYGMIGNPYQAVVDMKDVNYTNVLNNFIYVWDPNLGTVGQYVEVAINTGVSSPSSSDADEFLMPGQSVFVVTDASAPASVTFVESAKEVTRPTTSVFSTPLPESKIDVRLYQTDRYNQGMSESDAFGLRFDNSYSNAQDFSDATFLPGFNENIYTNVDGRRYAIEGRQLPQNNEVINLNIYGYEVTDYTLYLNKDNLNIGNVETYLVDNFTNTRMVIQDGISTYDFNVDFSNPSTFEINRFDIEFTDGTLSNSRITDADISLYPNPSNGAFTISTPNLNSEKQIVVFNSIGQQVMNLTTAETVIQVERQGLDSGIYFVNISVGDDQVTKKLIIK